MMMDLFVVMVEGLLQLPGMSALRVSVCSISHRPQLWWWWWWCCHDLYLHSLLHSKYCLQLLGDHFFGEFESHFLL